MYIQRITDVAMSEIHLGEIAVAVFLFFITRMFVKVLFDLKFHRKLPPGPKGWPVVGVIPLLGSMPHVALAKMAKKYGPVMYLKMGTCGMVVASTPNTARAFLKTLDINFSNRPPNAAAAHTIYHSKDLVLADYGPRWKLTRKLCNLHMLGSKALDGWVRVRELEVGHMLRVMLEVSSRGEPVVVPEMLTYAMANMIGQAILSRRVFESKGSESNEFKDMVVELMTITGHFNIGDYIPSIEWMDLQGIGRRVSILVKKFDALITKMMEQHAAITGHDKEKSNFLDFLMANAEFSEGERLTVMNIKALLLNLFAAGTDTSSSTIEWALAEMLKNPKIFGKAHEEMDRVIGRDRRLKESDILKLPYLQAICKEAMRMHPSTPLNLPRISTEPCMVDGYYIPKGSRLSVNIWAIGRDHEVWEDPLEFTPERFLDERFSKIEPRGNDFELIPFGAGRRICVGARMGIVMVQYILGTLVHSFEWKLPSHASELNMDETFGLALQKTVPLSALVSPRLSPNAYAI